jgi:hypothetical protein
MTIEELTALCAKIRVQLDPLVAQRDDLDKQIIALNKRRKEAEERIDALRYEAMQTSGEINWSVLIDAGPSGDRYYKESKTEIAKLAPSGGIEFSGYFQETQQHALRVKFKRGDKQQIEEVATVLELLIPLYKPLPDFEDWVIFDIFEESLSEFGSYKFAYNFETKKWYFGPWRSHSRHKKGDMFTATWQFGPYDTAEELATQISNNIWYEI